MCCIPLRIDGRAPHGSRVYVEHGQRDEGDKASSRSSDYICIEGGTVAGSHKPKETYVAELPMSKNARGPEKDPTTTHGWNRS